MFHYRIAVFVTVALSLLSGIPNRVLSQTNQCPEFVLNFASPDRVVPEFYPAANPQDWERFADREDILSWKDSRGNLWLFGGRSNNGGTEVFHADLWKLDLESNATAPQWINMTPEILPASWPAPRSGSYTYYTNNNELLLFSGRGSNGYFNDTWIYSISTGAWLTKIVSPASNGPVLPRENPVRDEVYDSLIGGIGQNGILRDQWYYYSSHSFSAWNFSSRDVLPEYHQYSVWRSTKYDRDIWYFGGEGADGTYTNDVRLYRSDRWQLYKGNSNSEIWPEPRSAAQSWVDANGDLMLYGGKNSTQNFNDLWRFTVASNRQDPQWEKVRPGAHDNDTDEVWPPAYSPTAYFSGKESDAGKMFLFQAKGPNKGIFVINPLKDIRKNFDSETVKNQSVNINIGVRPYLHHNTFFTVTQNPLHGTLSNITQTTTSFIYKPDKNWTGTDSFTLRLDPSNGACSKQDLKINIVVREHNEVCPKFAVTAVPINPPGVKPGGRRGVATWKDLNGDFWMWGGRLYSTPNNELWHYNIGTATGEPVWRKVTPSGISPAANYLYRGWVDASGNLWMMERTKLWKFIISSETWVDMTPADTTSDFWPLIGTQPNTWPPIMKDKYGNFVIFNGSHINRYSIGSNPGNPSWTRIVSPTLSDNGPEGRVGAVAWDGLDGFNYLFGGSHSRLGETSNDLWKLESATQSNSHGLWRKIHADGEWPEINYGANGWTDLVGDLWLFGGQDYQVTNNSMWRFSIGSNPKNPQWENLTPTNVGSAWPSARTHHACWTGNDGGLYLFGGSYGDFNAHSDQLWRFDSATASMQFEVEVNKSINISPALKDPGNIADLKIVSAPVHGTLSPVKEGNRTVSFVYTPHENHIGQDSFSIGLTNSPCLDPEYVKPVNVKIIPAQTSGIKNWGLYD